MPTSDTAWELRLWKAPKPDPSLTLPAGTATMGVMWVLFQIQPPNRYQQVATDWAASRPAAILAARAARRVAIDAGAIEVITLDPD